MIKYSEIDYKNPDYSSIYEKRIKFLKKINDDPSLVPRLLKFYKENPKKLDMPVVAVILQRCTKLCRVPAAEKKK